MPNSHPTTTTEAPDAAWLSVAAASAALGVSPKTVWRRARSGELTARKVAGERGAKVWEVCLDPTGQSNRTTGQTQTAKQPDNRPTSPENERKASGQTIRTPTGQPAKASGQKKKGNGKRLNDARDEVKFLRGVIEQLQRDGAETRAALRAALKLAGDTPAPQLTAGEVATTPNGAPQRAPTRAAATDSPASANGSQRATQAPKRPITYDSIADEIEAMMELKP